MSPRFLQVVVPVLAVFAITFLSGCQSDNLQVRLHNQGEAYIRDNITVLVPTTTPAGGTYRVTNVRWMMDGRALVTFSDGRTELRGYTTVTDRNGTVTAGRIILDTTDSDASSAGNSSSSSAMSFSSAGVSMSVSASASLSAGMSASSSSGRGLGAFCGGIAGFPCDAGYTCKLDGTYPDAGGTCVTAY